MIYINSNGDVDGIVTGLKPDGTLYGIEKGYKFELSPRKRGGEYIIRGYRETAWGWTHDIELDYFTDDYKDAVGTLKDTLLQLAKIRRGELHD